MTDPRSAIPDTVLTAPDGSKWLVRSAQLIVAAERNAVPRIVVDGELLPVLSVNADGIATVLPGVGTRHGFTYALSDVPEDLAARIAVWMAEQAGVNGQKMLAKLYPPPPAAAPQEIAP